MTEYRVGYIVGSLASESINRTLARALIKLAPDDLELVEIEIRDLPLYNRDLDDDFPTVARDLKKAIAAVDAILFVTPEYNRGIPGALKNAIDWGSRPWGRNSFSRKPSAVIGASTGKLGTAIAQQNLRSVLSFCNAPQMNAPEAYVQSLPGEFLPDGQVTDPETAEFLREFMAEFREFITRVLTVLPRTTERQGSPIELYAGAS